jgi:hypothetical protein
VPVAPGFFNAAEVSCPNGLRLIGGGYRLIPNNVDHIRVNENGTGFVNPGVWHVGAVNDDPNANDPAPHLIAIGICAS